jgi:hypothetical protein
MAICYSSDRCDQSNFQYRYDVLETRSASRLARFYPRHLPSMPFSADAPFPSRGVFFLASDGQPLVEKRISLKNIWA